MVKLVIFLLLLFAIWYYYDIKLSKKAKQKSIEKKELTEAQKSNEKTKYMTEFNRVIQLMAHAVHVFKLPKYLKEAPELALETANTIDWNVYIVDENYKKYFSPQCVLWRSGLLGGMQVSGCSPSQI